jgi:predicted nucleic acid-binding protein
MADPASTLTLVFDSSVLSCFARAGHLEVLNTLTSAHRRVMVRAVKEEIDRGVLQYSRLGAVQQCGWLDVVRGDSLVEMAAFSHYVGILGCGERDVGEAATLAWAEAHHAVAVLDDQAGVNAGKQRGVQIKRTLALISTGVQQGILAEDDAAALVDDLIRSGGARFPCDGRRFVPWCREKGLLV